MSLILPNLSPGASSKPSTPTKIQILSEMLHVLRPLVELILRFGVSFQLADAYKTCYNPAFLKCSTSSFARRISPQSWAPLVVAMTMDSISLWLSSMLKGIMDQ